MLLETPSGELSRARQSALTAVVVDASCFSLPYDYSLCEALGREGCRVILARSQFRAGAWTRPASGFEVWDHFYRRSHRRNPAGIMRAPWQAAKAAEHLLDMKTLLRRVRQIKPDVIHFQWLPAPVLDNLYLQKLSAIAPLVLTVHNTDPHGTWLQRFHQKLGWEAVFRHFRAIIVHSAFSQRQIIQNRWASAASIHIVPHGVLDYYHEQPAGHSPVASPAQSVLFFGNIEAYKGLDVLLPAFARLPAALQSETRVLVVGTPNIEIAPLQKLARDLGIDSRIVWRLGFVPEEELPQLFREASVVVLPYRRIDQSGVLMTAIAFGKAIVASRVGGIPETIKDGVHGALVDPGDVEGLSAALRHLLADPARRRAMEQATAHLAKAELSWTNSARKTLDVYRELVAR